MLAHVATAQLRLEALQVKIKTERGDAVRRVGNGHRAEIFAIGRAVGQQIYIASNLIATQGQIAIHREPLGNIPLSHKLHSATVAIRHIHIQSIRAIVNHSRRNQLVTILHIVEIKANGHPLCIESVAQLIVKQAFWQRLTIILRKHISVGKIGAGRLLICDGE